MYSTIACYIGWGVYIFCSNESKVSNSKIEPIKKPETNDFLNDLVIFCQNCDFDWWKVEQNYFNDRNFLQRTRNSNVLSRYFNMNQNGSFLNYWFERIDAHLAELQITIADCIGRSRVNPLHHVVDALNNIRYGVLYPNILDLRLLVVEISAMPGLLQTLSYFFIGGMFLLGGVFLARNFYSRIPFMRNDIIQQQIIDARERVSTYLVSMRNGFFVRISQILLNLFRAFFRK